MLRLPEGRAHGAVATALSERFIGWFAIGFHHSDWSGYRLFVRANMPSVKQKNQIMFCSDIVTRSRPENILFLNSPILRIVFPSPIC